MEAGRYMDKQGRTILVLAKKDFQSSHVKYEKGWGDKDGKYGTMKNTRIVNMRKS